MAFSIMSTKDAIEKNFTYYPPKGTQAARYAAVRELAKKFALAIDELCPVECREKSLAITKLEECVMWTNAGIARNE